MTAEPIARVIADLRAGRVRHVVADPRLNQIALKRATTATVVDATAVYTSLVDKNEPVLVYEDHPNVAPPWQSAAICYVTEAGTVVAMHVTADEIPKGDRRELWEPSGVVDWDRVRWVLDTFVWTGGRSKSAGPAPTVGPTHLWRYAVYEDGEPADLSWIQLLPDCPLETWNTSQLVLLASLNFLGCRNVSLVEPVRPRPSRRRLDRLGVKVCTINVTPAGKSYRGGGSGENAGVPLTSVRGHFSSYGPQYGKGLLFGKFAGRFWVPQHARGSKEHGESEHDYRLTPR